MVNNIGLISLTLVNIFGCICYSVAEISNEIDFSTRENLPKPVSYFTLPQPDDQILNSEKPQEARFSYPAVTNLESYGPNNVLAHGYYPWKFDLGGLLLGSVVGLGALLLIPKVIHLLVPELAALGSPYGSPYKRNVDFIPQGVSEIVTQFEKVLSENNINSSECLQKAICSYIQSTVPKSEEVRSINTDENNFDKSISSNLINFLIDGSKFKTAVENGKQEVACSILYPKCPFNQDSIATGIRQLIFSTTASSTRDPNLR